MLIDTHAHLFWDDFKDDFEKVIENAKINDVEKIISPGVDLRTSKASVELAEKYPGVIYAAAGIHPEEAVKIDNWSKTLAEIEELLGKSEVVGIGEVGIDLFNEEMRAQLKEQQQLFREMVKLAIRYDLPMLIHTRESLNETLEVLDELPSYPRGVFHCFSAHEEDVGEVLKRGFYISFCGNITWSKRVARIADSIPLAKLLVETDSPFMVPRDESGEPMGGNLRNTPANVKILAKFQASRRKMSTHEFCEIVTENTRKLFNI